MSKPALVSELQTFQMKGSLIAVSVLYLLDTDLDLFTEQVRDRVETAQGFFQNSPVVLDLSLLPRASRLDFVRLNQILRELALVPVALRGGGDTERRGALSAGLGLLNDTRPGSPNPKRPTDPAASSPASATPSAASPTLVVEQLVRSGQQIYARNSDLVVLSGVSPGAEVLADGNIHVYGPLRGRAVAGATGETEARIFCASLEAELVSIAGSYQLSEDMPTSLHRRRVAIRLLGEDLHYDALE